MRKTLIMASLFCLAAMPAVSAPTIKITSPKAGDKWCAGSASTITWTKTGTMSNFVNIRLWQGGAKLLDIADHVQNSGTYTWTIPAAHPSFPANSYQVKVVTVDNQVSDMSPMFGIKYCASITVLKPDATSCWDEGKDYLIQWTKTGAMDDHVKIQMLMHGAWLYDLAVNAPNTGSYSNHVSGSPYWPDYNFSIRIQTMDGAVTGTGQEFPIATGCGIDWHKFIDKLMIYDIGWKIPDPGPDPGCPDCPILDLGGLLKLIGTPPGPVELELIKGGAIAVRLGRFNSQGRFEPNLTGGNKLIGENGLRVEALGGANARAIIGDSGLILRFLTPGTKNILGTKAVRLIRRLR
jgi:hypothetical protein